MPNDITNWTEKHFIVLKKSLEQFIPLIRFFEISSKDFYYKVRPYKKILPQNIYEDLMSHYLAETEPKTINLSPRMGRWRIDSVIIKPKHAIIIANWIKRIDGKLCVSRVSNHQHAVYDYANNGAHFGQSDLVLNNNNGACNKYSYEDSILDTNNFRIEEIEVFKIVEK
ncbi:88_t:CDS:2 [Dentiscutata erythropus]|uniref:88_t:CDS:1 n=1 Tax=Dentiscutata erythropus TaxID=1348616 RepID=A0A9N8VHR6_9GLOM|nr:88_t:CDS:2 [Dentiscutata erythropus]